MGTFFKNFRYGATPLKNVYEFSTLISKTSCMYIIVYLELLNNEIFEGDMGF